MLLYFHLLYNMKINEQEEVPIKITWRREEEFEQCVCV